MERGQIEDSHITISLAIDLTRNWTLVQEVSDQLARSDKEIAQLKNHLREESEWSLQVTMERDQVFSQLSAQGSQLTSLHSQLTQIMGQMSKLHSPALAIREGATPLAP